MKKSLLILSLILLFAALGMEAVDVAKYTELVAYGSIGTFLLGAVYPPY